MTHSLFHIWETELAAHRLKWTTHPKEPSLGVSGIWDLAPASVPQSKVFLFLQGTTIIEKSPVAAFKQI